MQLFLTEKLRPVPAPWVYTDCETALDPIARSPKGRFAKKMREAKPLSTKGLTSRIFSFVLIGDCEDLTGSPEEPAE